MKNKAHFPFRQLFVLLAVAQSQFNFREHFSPWIFSEDLPECPDLHVYVVGLSPHNCVSYRKECQGVTQVQIKILGEGQTILCHPNFQPNLGNPFVFQNFSVDPYQSITLRIDEQDQTKFYYTNNIQLEQCYIVYAYKNNQNQESSHCLFYRKQYIIGNPPLKFGVTTEGIGVSNDEKELYDCDSDCLSCNTPPDYKACDLCRYNQCGSYNKNGRLQKDGKDLGVCTPVCQVGQCATCKVADQCLECQVWLQTSPGMFFYYKSYFLNDGVTILCSQIINCVQYEVNLQGSIRCVKCNFGNYLSEGRCEQCLNPYISLGNCLHCDPQQCYVCRGGYYIENGTCVQDKPCAQICQTCLNNSPSQCTSCNLGGILIANYQCLCDENIQYYEVDANCLHCKKGICEICLSFTECLQCKTETFRYLDGTKCFCKDGYYDNGDLNYVCGVCHPTCQTCFGGDAASCLTCIESQNRKIVQGFCICQQGFGQNKNDLTDVVCKRMPLQVRHMRI